MLGNDLLHRPVGVCNPPDEVCVVSEAVSQEGEVKPGRGVEGLSGVSVEYPRWGQVVYLSHWPAVWAPVYPIHHMRQCAAPLRVGNVVMLVEEAEVLNDKFVEVFNRGRFCTVCRDSSQLNIKLCGGFLEGS